MFGIKLYNTYNEVKDVFKKPVLRWSFRKWTKSSLLPVWRRGNSIRLGKYGEYESEWHWAKMVSCSWNELGKKKHPFISKLFKPLYFLPIWCSFYFFNHDVFFKTKYDEVRFEFPPQLSIVFFGWSLNFWLTNPTRNPRYDDDYWESILTYLDNQDLDETRKELGAWTLEDGTEEEVLHKEFLK